MAKYLLSRHPIKEDYSQRLGDADAILHPTLFLTRVAARCGNVALFESLITRDPLILTTWNGNIGAMVTPSIEGGVGLDIWRSILAHEPHASEFKNWEYGLHGCLLEHVAKFGSKELLEFFLGRGVDPEPEGYSLLQQAKAYKLDKDRLELIEKYSKRSAEEDK